MLYDILEDFPGSQDGTRTEQFKAGTQRDLSVWLGPLAVSAGWARLASAPIAVENKAVITDGHQTGTLRLRRK
jgi:hypothetical protein